MYVTRQQYTGGVDCAHDEARQEAKTYEDIFHSSRVFMFQIFRLPKSLSHLL